MCAVGANDTVQEPQFPVQRHSVAVQSGDAAAVKGSIRVWDTTQFCSSFIIFWCNVGIFLHWVFFLLPFLISICMCVAMFLMYK